LAEVYRNEQHGSPLFFVTKKRENLRTGYVEPRRSARFLPRAVSTLLCLLASRLVRGRGQKPPEESLRSPPTFRLVPKDTSDPTSTGVQTRTYDDGDEGKAFPPDGSRSPRRRSGPRAFPTPGKKRYGRPAGTLPPARYERRRVTVRVPFDMVATSRESGTFVSLLTVSSTFDLLFKVLFTFPSLYLFAIGLPDVFSFG
jgi:hypothetical protein